MLKQQPSSPKNNQQPNPNRGRSVNHWQQHLLQIAEDRWVLLSLRSASLMCARGLSVLNWSVSVGVVKFHARHILFQIPRLLYYYYYSRRMLFEASYEILWHPVVQSSLAAALHLNHTAENSYLGLNSTLPKAIKSYQSLLFITAQYNKEGSGWWLACLCAGLHHPQH